MMSLIVLIYVLAQVLVSHVSVAKTDLCEGDSYLEDCKRSCCSGSYRSWEPCSQQCRLAILKHCIMDSMHCDGRSCCENNGRCKYCDHNPVTTPTSGWTFTPWDLKLCKTDSDCVCGCNMYGFCSDCSTPTESPTIAPTQFIFFDTPSSTSSTSHHLIRLKTIFIPVACVLVLGLIILVLSAIYLKYLKRRTSSRRVCETEEHTTRSPEHVPRLNVSLPSRNVAPSTEFAVQNHNYDTELLLGSANIQRELPPPYSRHPDPNTLPPPYEAFTNSGYE